MGPQQVAAPWVPPATPAPTRDTAQETLNSDARMKQRQGMAATELSSGAGMDAFQKQGVSATKKLLGSAV